MKQEHYEKAQDLTRRIEIILKDISDTKICIGIAKDQEVFYIGMNPGKPSRSPEYEIEIDSVSVLYKLRERLEFHNKELRTLQNIFDKL